MGYCQPVGPMGALPLAPARSGFICIALAASAGLGVKGQQGRGGAQNSVQERKRWVRWPDGQCEDLGVRRDSKKLSSDYLQVG